MLLEPGAILGQRYEIINRIGQGGMSNVYRARDTKLKREVAVKVLKEEFAKDLDFIGKFEREASSAASLNHINIVGVYDVCHDNALHYIVMEYIAGRTLKEVIVEDAPFSEARTINYGIQILNAIKLAHRKGIIHRDIKPQNILVTSEEILKVTDFGIAKAANSSTIVLNGDTVGSVYYFSPEQAKGKHAGETSDLYSCGIILFEMITKHVPFESDNHVSIALKHINDPIPNPSAYNIKISKGLEQIILKATSKRVEERYQTADLMIKDLQEALENPDLELGDTQDADLAYTVLLTPEQSEFIRKNEIPSTWSMELSTANEKVSIDEDSDAYTAFGTSSSFVTEVEPASEPVAVEENKVESNEDVPVLSKWIAIFGGVFAALIIVGSAVGMYMTFGANKEEVPTNILVPSIVDMTIDEAQLVAGESGFIIGVVGEKENNTVVEGTILEQIPKPNITAAPDSTIQVVVSTLPVDISVIVPDVVGLDSSQAQTVLEEEGLWYYIAREYSDYYEIGKVIEQNPSADSIVDKGDYIELVISSGADIRYSEVPNLYNLSQAQATNSLLAYGLTLGDVSEEYSDVIDEGKVIYQEYIPGRSVEIGTSVNIVISMGREPEPEIVETPTPEPFFSELHDMFENTFSAAYREVEEQVLDYYDEVTEEFYEKTFDDEVFAEDNSNEYSNTNNSNDYNNTNNSNSTNNSNGQNPNYMNNYADNNDADEPFDADQAYEADKAADEADNIETQEQEYDDYGYIEYRPEEEVSIDFDLLDNLPMVSDTPVYLEEPVEEEPELVTKTYNVTLPASLMEDASKTSFHVIITFQTATDEQTLFNGVLNKEQFPYPVTVTGSGEGRLTVYFDAKAWWNDPYSF